MRTTVEQVTSNSFGVEDHNILAEKSIVNDFPYITGSTRPGVPVDMYLPNLPPHLEYVNHG
jgi:hypothetical protein